jgi:hypothetical protein
MNLSKQQRQNSITQSVAAAAAQEKAKFTAENQEVFYFEPKTFRQGRGHYFL